VIQQNNPGFSFPRKHVSSEAVWALKNPRFLSLHYCRGGTASVVEVEYIKTSVGSFWVILQKHSWSVKY
jgi:hypothetical protein